MKRIRKPLTIEQKAIVLDYQRLHRLAFGKEHKAYMKAYHRSYYTDNKQKILADNQAWRDNNPDRHRFLNTRWQRNIKRRKYSKLYLREYRKRDPERFQQYEARRKNKQERSRLHYKKNKAKIIDMVNSRRDKTYRIETPECTKKISTLQKKLFCHWCCRPLTERNHTIDHVTPLHRNGKHIPDNLVAACRSCNSSKGYKLVSEWTWKDWKEAA